MFILKKKYNELLQKNHDLENMLEFEISKSNKNNKYYKDSSLLLEGKNKELLLRNEELEKLLSKGTNVHIEQGKILKREIEKLELGNAGLNTKLSSLTSLVDKYKKANDGMGEIFNSMNRNIWCNEESKRQLKVLADDLINSDKYNKNELAKYLNEINFKISAGVKYEYVKLDAPIKEVKTNER